MSNNQIKVLLIEDNPGDVRFLHEMLTEVKDNPFELKCAERLSVGLKLLLAGGFDVLLLDLSLPDSQGFETFSKVYAQVSEVPIVVLTGLADETLATSAVQAGAQDYLVKGQVNSYSLVRSLRYAIERHQLQAALRGLSLVDDLTGLYNRRGFLTLAEQQLRVAQRAKKNFLIIYADLDAMKQINDSFGHQQGDLALIKTAEILKKTFRKSDILARMGGDEFVVLARSTSKESREAVIARLQGYLDACNAQGDFPCKLSISTGIACYDPEHPCSVDELLVRADKLMYAHKRDKYKS